MKTNLLIIAALFALVLTGCEKEYSEIEAEPKMVTVSVTMTSPDDEGTRVSLTPDSETPHGLILKWETGDKLMLCFEYNANYYYDDATMVPNSISNNGKTAIFTVPIPSAIPANALFNFYVVYQKTNSNPTDGGYFLPNTSKYFLEKYESTYLTLNNSRPMLYYSKENISNTASPEIGPINLAHAGWMLALHFKNITQSEINLPTCIYFTPIICTCVHNGDHSGNYYTPSEAYFDFSSTDTTYFSSTPDIQNIYLSINETGSPFYGGRLASGESIIFYRWIASEVSLPDLAGVIYFPGGPSDVANNLYGKKTLTYGKVYHMYTTWGGTEFERAAPY